MVGCDDRRPTLKVENGQSSEFHVYDSSSAQYVDKKTLFYDAVPKATVYTKVEEFSSVTDKRIQVSLVLLLPNNSSGSFQYFNFYSAKFASLSEHCVYPEQCGQVDHVFTKKFDYCFPKAPDLYESCVNWSDNVSSFGLFPTQWLLHLDSGIIMFDYCFLKDPDLIRFNSYEINFPSIVTVPSVVFSQVFRIAYWNLFQQVIPCYSTQKVIFCRSVIDCSRDAAQPPGLCYF